MFLRLSLILLFSFELQPSYAAPASLSKSQQAEVLGGIREVLANELYDEAIARDYILALDHFADDGLRDEMTADEFAIASHRALQRVRTDYHLGVFAPARASAADHDDGDTHDEAAPSDAIAVLAEENGVKLLRPSGFQAEARDVEAMYAALKVVASARALIIDLRGNAGGDAKLARLMVGCFFEETVPLYSIQIPRGRHARMSVYESEMTAECADLHDMPLAVLVDHNTASTAELFALLLQNRGRAVIIGEATAGGAHAAEYFSLPHGFAMLAPIGHVLDLLTGEDWEGLGVAPDIVVKPIDARMRAIDFFASSGQ